MSEYYQARRTNIADIAGLIGMGLGALVSSLSTLGVLATGFRTGEMERALLVFGGIVVSASAVSGVAGLLVGRWAGARWEHRHRARRPPSREEPATDQPLPGTSLLVRPLSQEAQQVLAVTVPDVAAGTWIGLWEGSQLVAVASDNTHLVIAPPFDPVSAREHLTTWMRQHSRESASSGEAQENA